MKNFLFIGLFSLFTVTGFANPQANEATPIAMQKAKNADDICFVIYGHRASRCNEEAGNNDAAFEECLTPVKERLKSCCQKRGGTADCAAEAN